MLFVRNESTDYKPPIIHEEFDFTERILSYK